MEPNADSGQIWFVEREGCESSRRRSTYDALVQLCEEVRVNNGSLRFGEGMGNRVPPAAGEFVDLNGAGSSSGPLGEGWSKTQNAGETVNRGEEMVKLEVALSAKLWRTVVESTKCRPHVGNAVSAGDSGKGIGMGRFMDWLDSDSSSESATSCGSFETAVSFFIRCG
jgi:hypothetical protein